ncbi:Maf family protein [Fontimonas thermophila]|uniref:Maf family protein n=1 Tax=Fontimonas thermophila TaxID=1076937 RepID=UPI00190E6343|nr:nucleoside triphosphate pyrophosphatase [Fontimonas thermophila]
MQLVLASQSPRRQALLAQLGLRFRVCPADVVEIARPGEPPADYAGRIALAKARAGAARSGADLPVLGADTDVVLDGRILGKPVSRAHALELLQQLSDRPHEVYSAVALVHQNREAVRVSVTQVWMGPIAPEQAEAYWASGEPADKAGAYGIQGLGAVFVREIRGSYSGVVGLPLYETCALLREFGIDVLAPNVSRAGSAR